MTWLAIAFGAFVLLIVLAADLGVIQSLLPYVPYAYVSPGGDKIGHLVLMGMLSFLVNLAFRAERLRLSWAKPLKGTLLVLALVALEEASQSLLPHRSFSLADLAFDAVGIVGLGLVAERVVRRRMRREPTARFSRIGSG